MAIRPPQIYLGADSPATQKVMLPSWLLHTQQKNGHAIESMYAIVHQAPQKEVTLELWVIGINEFSIGGGLLVDGSGFIQAHHFMPLDSTKPLIFYPGSCKISVFAKAAGQRGQQELLREELILTSDQASLLGRGDMAIMFNWSPIEGKCIAAEVDTEPLPKSKNSGFLERLQSLNPFATVKT